MKYFYLFICLFDSETVSHYVALIGLELRDSSAFASPGVHHHTGNSSLYPVKDKWVV